MTAISLSPWDLGVASALVVADGLIFVGLGLQLHRPLIIACVRMVLQLLAIGFVLRAVFAAGSPALVLLVTVLMAVVATREVAARPEQRLVQLGNYTISAAGVAVVRARSAARAVATAIRPAPWWDPRYAIPLVGLVLGSVLNSSSLALDSLLGGVVREAPAIEAQLALGATMVQATRRLRRESIRRGMLPVINQMSAAGLITLPGIMTGQILAGMDPIDAVKYQILLMFLLSGAAGLAALVVVVLAARRLTDQRDRLRLDRLAPRRK
jgi:putative ABC transport system permease protein